MDEFSIHDMHSKLEKKKLHKELFDLRNSEEILLKVLVLETFPLRLNRRK
jgi:hypothetical protein